MDGKVAVITGSTSGIGLGVATAFVNCGCSVVITGLGDDDLIDGILQKLRSEAKPDVEVNYIPAELSDTSSVEQFCLDVDKLYPNGIDILINNAGIQHICSIDKFPLEVWNSMLAIGLTAPFLLIKHFLPNMKKKGWGRIINVSSVMALNSSPGKTPYSACKSGLCGLTRGVAVEVVGSGVTCNAICPGGVDTPLIKNQSADWIKSYGIENDTKAQMAAFMTENPMGRLMSTHEVAEYIIFLSSETTRTMNGASVVIDGGRTAFD